MTTIRLLDARRGLNLKCRELFRDEKIADAIYRCLCDGIEECEAAEPERKMGKWYKPTGMMPPEHFGRHRCSECDGFAMHDWKHHKEQLTDFCPNCGVDTRGKQDG